MVAFTVTLLSCPAITALPNPSNNKTPSKKSKYPPASGQYDDLPEAISILQTAQKQPLALQSSSSVGKASIFTPLTAPGSVPSFHLEGGYRKLIQSVLVIAPVNTLQNWANEYRQWTPADLRQCVHVTVISSSDGTSSKKTSGGRENNLILERIKKLKKWYNTGGVLVIGYTMFLDLTTAKSYGKKGSTLVDWEEAVHYLMKPGPDLVVADEAHTIKVCLFLWKILHATIFVVMLKSFDWFKFIN